MQCKRLCTSGFEDGIMFSYDEGNRLESKTARMFCPVRQVAALGQSLPFPTASCFLLVFHCTYWRFLLLSSCYLLMNCKRVTCLWPRPFEIILSCVIMVNLCIYVNFDGPGHRLMFMVTEWIKDLFDWKMKVKLEKQSLRRPTMAVADLSWKL